MLNETHTPTRKIPLNKNDYPIWSDVEKVMLSSFNQAIKKTNLYVRYLRICGKNVKFCFVGNRLIEVVTSALNHHLVLDQENSADFTIYIWDSYSTKTAKPELKLTRRTRFIDPEQKWRIAAEGLPNYLTASDRKQGFLWVNSLSDYPLDRYATPLRSTLLWWLAGYGFHGLHAGAVGYQGKAALLIGNGGAGKSTTSLLCLQAGFDYLSDDIVLFDSQGQHKVHSLYNSAKVNALGAQYLSTQPVAMETSDRLRAVHCLYPSYQQYLSLSLPIHALILLNIGENDHTEFKPITPATAFTVLAPSTHRVLSIAIGNLSLSLSAIAELTRTVPCYQVNLGKNLDSIPVVIRSILEG
ncbi:hypothetical protein [Geminocystis sp. GBBB08]|uniref:hypothetical protein n=1 Tax=Geminocystis sp. GBBB08 TaxID=2604140 RepID=UPI0027E39897|nr:hypothetical protein [Geminocystis sp. GBBB08]MBL1209354.1 hypothetical protein [Geminocystis sp. GBBB08]